MDANLLLQPAGQRCRLVAFRWQKALALQITIPSQTPLVNYSGDLATYRPCPIAWRLLGLMT